MAASPPWAPWGLRSRLALPQPGLSTQCCPMSHAGVCVCMCVHACARTHVCVHAHALAWTPSLSPPPSLRGHPCGSSLHPPRHPRSPFHLTLRVPGEPLCSAAPVGGAHPDPSQAPQERLLTSHPLPQPAPRCGPSRPGRTARCLAHSGAAGTACPKGLLAGCARLPPNPPRYDRTGGLGPLMTLSPR